MCVHIYIQIKNEQTGLSCANPPARCGSVLMWLCCHVALFSCTNKVFSCTNKVVHVLMYHSVLMWLCSHVALFSCTNNLFSYTNKVVHVLMNHSVLMHQHTNATRNNPQKKKNQVIPAPILLLPPIIMRALDKMPYPPRSVCVVVYVCVCVCVCVCVRVCMRVYVCV